MTRNIAQSILASLALVAVFASATARPAIADQAATTRLIEGAAAIAAIATAINVEHKHQVATTVVGYLSDGSPVYQDGHIVSAQNGQSYYPSQYGEQVACSNNQCYVTGSNTGYNNGYNNGTGYNNGYNNGTGYNNGYNNGTGYNNGYNNGGVYNNGSVYNNAGAYNNVYNSRYGANSTYAPHRVNTMNTRNTRRIANPPQTHPQTHRRPNG